MQDLEWSEDSQFKKFETLIYFLLAAALNLEFLSQGKSVDVENLWMIEEESQMPEAFKTESGNPRQILFFVFTLSSSDRKE